MEEIKKKIREYLTILNKDVSVIDKENPKIIDFIIEDTLDRVLLYLNVDVLPVRLERILASIVNNGLNTAVKTYNEGLENDQRAVASMSDNGQSVSYSNEVQRNYANINDNDLFNGFTPLLNRYRRLNIERSAKI